MNLHEECLLKYLVNPLELFYTTELLKSNNELLSKSFDELNEIAKQGEINYNKICKTGKKSCARTLGIEERRARSWSFICRHDVLP